MPLILLEIAILKIRKLAKFKGDEIAPPSHEILLAFVWCGGENLSPTMQSLSLLVFNKSHSNLVF